MTGALANLHQDLQDLVGRTVAERYRVDSVIGVGGMAAVFRAHHEGLGRDVALKVLHPNVSTNAEMSARFDREARSASRLDHPNCVQVTDFGSTEEGMKFMAMQLLEGGELTDILGDAVDAPRAVELVLQILQGLDHAHKQGVVHRDVKPENIFMTRDHEGREVLKLVDFGIAKLTGAGTDKHKTTAGLVFGTPAYMSPEQAMGVEADFRADLYSVGVLFYQLLSGVLPIDNEDPVSLVRMQVSVDPDPLPASVPPVIAGVVGRLLEKDRDARFQSAAEAIQTLTEIQPLLVDEHISAVELVPAANRSTGVVMAAAPAVAPTVALRTRPAWVVPAAALGAALLVGLAISAVLGGGDDDIPSVSTTVVEPDPNDAEPGTLFAAATAGPSEDTLAEIDRLLLAKKVEAADALLSPLRDAFPEDATLMWRRGKVLVGQKKKEAQALAAYSAALQADETLLDERDFYAELHDLMRDRAVRDEALDLALHHMGPQGHKFLLEQVNDERRPLQYNDRHRALDELRSDEANVALINEKLNLALDVLQASESLTPCKSYDEALSTIESEPDFYFFNRVDKAVLPTAPEDPKRATQDDIEVCDGLEERRDDVLAQLAVLDPAAEELADGEEPAPGEPGTGGAGEGDTAAAKPKPKSRNKKSRGPDCSKFLGALNKKCRR